MSDFKNLNQEEINSIKENKEENKKAFPKFIIIMIASGCFGFVFALAVIRLFVNRDVFGENMTQFGQMFLDFQENIAPYFFLLNFVLLIVSIIFCGPTYKKSKKLWDEAEDKDDVVDKVDRILNFGMSVSSISIIIGVISLLCGMYRFLVSINTQMVVIAIGFVLYFANVIYILLFQKKAVELIKIIYPEKKGSVYDMKFADKWFETCDEYERAKIGKAAYDSYRTTSKLCSVIIVVFGFIGMFLPIGFLVSLVIGIIWLIMNISYLISASHD